MLDITAIKNAMQKHGLNQSELADRCAVTREAVSRWLAGESLPRPAKLKLLSDVLGVEISVLFAPLPGPTCIADSVVGAAAGATKEDQYAFEDMGWRLLELEPFVAEPGLFAPAALAAPSLDMSYVLAAAGQARRSIAVADGAPLTTRDLMDLNRAAGVRMLPAPWMGDRPGQQNTLRICLPGQATMWLVFGTNVRCIDLDAALAHALGFQYGRCRLVGPALEEFARTFAQALCAPGVYRHRDPSTTVKESFFADDDAVSPAFVAKCEGAFGTPVYAAVAQFQRYEGGRNPAFVASLINLGLGSAVDLTFVLAGVGYSSLKAQENSPFAIPQ